MSTCDFAKGSNFMREEISDSIERRKEHIKAQLDMGYIGIAEYEYRLDELDKVKLEIVD